MLRPYMDVPYTGSVEVTVPNSLSSIAGAEFET